MPSPVGHALGGLIVAVAAAPLHGQLAGHGVLRLLHMPPDARGLLALCALAACLPDVDFAWGRHNMETHSVGFAVILGVLALAWQRSGRAGAAAALATATHVLFDWLGSDDSPPIGVMALWPFSQEFFFADAWWFAAISRRYWRDDFVSQNVLAVLRELAILVPILAALVWWRSRIDAHQRIHG